MHGCMPFIPQACFAGMRAKGPKADLALIAADSEAVAAGVFTINVMAAAPVDVLPGGAGPRRHRPGRCVELPWQPHFILLR